MRQLGMDRSAHQQGESRPVTFHIVGRQDSSRTSMYPPCSSSLGANLARSLTPDQAAMDQGMPAHRLRPQQDRTLEMQSRRQPNPAIVSRASSGHKALLIGEQNTAPRVGCVEAYERRENLYSTEEVSSFSATKHSGSKSRASTFERAGCDAMACVETA
ncbi:hypothetical protein ANO11243_013320 [Dothideomycetidae sp. 11243]|nr:hypothetical protein ANO11243_013320 [fungal sp. No.11243]